MSMDGVLSTIPYKVFFTTIGVNLEEVLQKNKDSHEIRMAEIDIKTDYSHIQLEKLINIKKLGQGQFGKVYLVHEKETQEIYALKEILKGRVY